MIEHVHKHITSELHQNTKTDIIFILSSIMLNLIILLTNSNLANNKDGKSNLVVMFIFVTLLVLVNIVAIFGLIKGKQTRTKLINGLIAMYRDQNVAKYYDESLMGNYNIRYNLFIMVVVCTGVIATVVPFIMR